MKRKKSNKIIDCGFIMHIVSNKNLHLKRCIRKWNTYNIIAKLKIYNILYYFKYQYSK